VAIPPGPEAARDAAPPADPPVPALHGRGPIRPTLEGRILRFAALGLFALSVIPVTSPDFIWSLDPSIAFLFARIEDTTLLYTSVAGVVVSVALFAWGLWLDRMVRVEASRLPPARPASPTPPASSPRDASRPGGHLLLVLALAQCACSGPRGAPGKACTSAGSSEPGLEVHVEIEGGVARMGLPVWAHIEVRNVDAARRFHVLFHLSFNTVIRNAQVETLRGIADLSGVKLDLIRTFAEASFQEDWFAAMARAFITAGAPRLGARLWEHFERTR
jgi:hypothetical protein